MTVDFECGGATAAAIATLTDELEFMVGRSQSLPPPRPKIASVHVLPAEGDAFTQCAVQAAATNATAHNALSPLPFLRCVSAGADCEAIALGEDAIGACYPEAYGIDGDELRRCIREKGGGGGRSLRDDEGVTIRSAADSGRCALSVNTCGVRIVPPSALKELVDNGVDLRYIGSVDVDCCGGGACNVTDWACEAYTHTERLERNCTYSQQVNARCSSHRDCNSEHCASRFCAVPPPVSVSSGRTCRNPDAVPGATNLDGPILRRMVLDTSTGRKARVPCGPRCPEGELCAENEAQVTRCNDGECCTADGYCGGGSSSLEVNTGLFENALGIGRQSSVLAQACYENEGDWRYVECPRPPAPPPARPPAPPTALEVSENPKMGMVVWAWCVALAGALVLCVLLLCVTTFRLLLRIAAAHDTSPWTLLGLWVARSSLARLGVGAARGVRRVCRWLWTHLPVLPGMHPAATPHAVWARICRKANKEPTEGPPDVERRPFVEQSVLEQKLWGTAAREAAQLREWLQATRSTTPFIETLVSSCSSQYHGLCADVCEDCAANADPEAGLRLIRAFSVGRMPSTERSKASLCLGELLRFCLNEQGAGGRSLWEEWKAALLATRPNEATKVNMEESEPVSVHEFAALLLSPCNSAVQPRSATTDATEPLTSYWIDSSHNSFLEGDQLTSGVSADMYRRLLLSGTRCLEIDCWNGRWGPRVTHRLGERSPLLCGSVAFGEVVAAIAEHAFTSSPLPVILSLEMHCSAKQQRTVAKELIDTLGDMLLRTPRSPHERPTSASTLRELHRTVISPRCGSTRAISGISRHLGYVAANRCSSRCGLTRDG